MKLKTAWAMACVVALGGAAVWGQATAPKVPTQDDIQKTIEAKSYRPAMQQIARVWPMANVKDQTDYDKYTLLMMRGECLVQLKDPQTATLAYKQAGEAAGSLDKYEAARAMVLLLGKKGPGMTYVPKTGDKTPLDLLDLEARKKAMEALFETQLAADGQAAMDVSKATSLPPILEMLPRMRDLHALEMQATGTDKETLGLVRALGDQCETLMDEEVSRVDQQGQMIEKLAMAPVENVGGGYFTNVNGKPVWVNLPGVVGLNPEQRQILRDNIDYLEKIGQTCDDFYGIAQRYDKNGERWRELAKRARAVRAHQVAVHDNT